jgi:hypothetical protein
MRAVVVKFPGRADLPRTVRRGHVSDIPSTFIEELAALVRIRPLALRVLRQYVHEKLIESQQGAAR